MSGGDPEVLLRALRALLVAVDTHPVLIECRWYPGGAYGSAYTESLSVSLRSGETAVVEVVQSTPAISLPSAQWGLALLVKGPGDGWVSLPGEGVRGRGVRIANVKVGDIVSFVVGRSEYGAKVVKRSRELPK